MKDLSVGKESKLIIRFAIPLLLGLVFQQLYSVADSIIVGKFLPNGEQALAAIGAAFPIIFFLISLVVGISSGATIIISHYFGDKDYEGIQKAVDTINIFLVICAIIISVIGIVFAQSIFEYISIPADIIPDAVTYMQIYSSGFILMFGFHGVSAILRGVGDSRKPLYILIISSILNVLLDIVFIIVFKTGIAGVAWATVVSQGLTFIAIVLYLNKTHPILRMRLRNIVFDYDIFKQSVKIGLPSGMQQAFVGLGSVALMAIVSKFGTVAVAAYSVAGRIDMLCSVPAIALSMALSTFVGQNMGARKIDRVVKGYTITLSIGIGISLLLSLVTIIFRHQIMSLFTNELTIIPIGVDYLMIVSPFYFAFAILFISNGVLRGAGDTIIPMFVTLFALWGIRVPLSYWLSTLFGEIGIWWGIPAGWLFGMTFSTAYYLLGRWKMKIIVRKRIQEIEE
jgi:putative MATE family efflux protein